jgi:hypothetical protein
MKKIITIVIVLVVLTLAWKAFSTPKTTFIKSKNVPTGLSYANPDDVLPNVHPEGGWLSLEKNFATAIKFPPYGYLCKESQKEAEVVGFFTRVERLNPFRTFKTDRYAIVCGSKYIVVESNLSGYNYWGPFEIK